MASGDPSVVAAVWAELRRRAPIWRALAALIACSVALRLVPFVGWWGVAYGTLRLDLWWPLIFVGVCAFFYLAGHRRHQRTGEAQFFPIAGRFARAVCVALLATMLLLTASHWGMAWSVVQLAAIAGANYFIALALVGYAELWRTRCHGAVEATVARQVKANSLEPTIEHEVRLDRWGSPHGLNLVHRHYQQTKQAALSGTGTAVTDLSLSRKSGHR